VKRPVGLDVTKRQRFSHRVLVLIAFGSVLLIIGPNAGAHLSDRASLPVACYQLEELSLHHRTSQQFSFPQRPESVAVSPNRRNPKIGEAARSLGRAQSIPFLLMELPSQTTAQGAARGQSGTSQNGQTSGATSQSTMQQTGGVGPQRVSGAAKVSPAPSTLSLADAINLASQNNLATLLAQERKREAAGFEKESLAGLLPNVSGVAYQANLTLNLAALGFQPGSFPGFSATFIGPFSNFDARLRLQQTIFSLSAIRTYQAGRAGLHVAELQEELAREQVATFTALSYLEALRSERALEAVQSDVKLAESLFTLATDQRNAGVATGVDVTRAETRLALQQVRLAEAQTVLEAARLQLQRVIGVRLGSDLTLTDPLRFTEDNLPALDAAVAQAEQDRPEVRVSAAQVTLSDYQQRAVRADLLPNVEFLGDYGVSGITPANTDLPTRRVAVQLNVPIFNGGLTQGRIAVAASQKRQSELELSNMRGQVEEDVRLAFANLRSTAEVVRASDKSLALAQRELEMARDRFRAGVADNLEVLSAQTSLAEARAVQVTALAQYNATRLNVAAALGRAQAFRL
jgi:outer membrane protein